MDTNFRTMAQVYIFNKDKVLMLYRIGSRALKKTKWVGIGGHMEKCELNNPKSTMLREICEESKIKEEDLKNIKLKYITIRNKKGEIRQNYYFFAQLSEKNNTNFKSNEGSLEWVNINEVLNRDMPDSARACLKHYLNEGKNNDLIYGVMGIKDNNKTKYLIGELK